MRQVTDPRTAGPRLLEVRRIRLVEVAPPSPSPEERQAMDRVWEESVRANPSLFDGPVVACAGLEWEQPRHAVIHWARTTFRTFALRRVPGATSWLPGLFVSVVQPADDGRLLVGRMAPTTATPGRWQFPGGGVEPPGAREALDLAALRRNAARELLEETGVQAAPDDLTPWLVTHGKRGSVGVLFVAPPRPGSLLRDRYAAVVASETALGRDPELDRIAFVGSPEEAAGLGGRPVDYLEPVVTRYAAATHRGSP
ncbi:NUDIX domain-containing protein [Nonomuraea pusilla]|uniref:NUDIX domain-containing protein n=1 Tax=Nonomuraea pusilla TaxID=46177 RepID=A0A1H8EVE5_9ACTN|nr:NUDIX domain-containing protein [Nonomuraea pusilla]